MPLGNDEAKVRMLQQDAEADEPRAQRHLANRYLRGQGVPHDPELGARWMRAAAEGGLAPAQRAFGELLEEGTGVSRDPQAALYWYRCAADQNDPVARSHIQRLEAN